MGAGKEKVFRVFHDTHTLPDLYHIGVIYHTGYHVSGCMCGIPSNREGKRGGMFLFLKKDVFIAWDFTSVAPMEAFLICNVGCDEN